MKHKDLVDQLTEAIKIDVEVGDTILTGRFKNKKTKVTSIGKDKHGMPTINGRKATTFRTAPKSIDESEVKTIHSLLQKFGNSSKDATDMMKKHYKKVAQKFKGQSPRDKTMAIIGISLLGEVSAVKGGKITKFITGYNLTMKGKKYKQIEFETIKVDNSTNRVFLKVLAPKKLFGMEIPVKFQTLRRGPFLKTDTSKKLKESVNRPNYKNYIDDGHFFFRDISESKDIKKVIGVYGGRFQPFGPHHLKTYQWLKTKVDEAYVTTSNIKKPPRHPMNFKEKVRHMVKMGVPANRIVEEKTPYIAKNLLSKFGDDVAVVYIFGKKDAGRLTGGKYFQDYKSNKGNLKGHKENGYIMTAPHVDMNISGVEISGTGIRKLLGSPEFKNNREKLFKKTFGYFDKGLYNMMTNKFGKLFEFYAHLFENSNLQTAGETDDGPSMFSSLSAYMTRAELEAGRLGWELTDLLTDTDSYNSQYRDYRKDTEYPKGPVDSVSFGPAGINEPSAQNLSDYVGTELWNKWLDHIDMILSNQDYEYVDDLAKSRKAVVKDSPKTAKQMDVEEPTPTDDKRGNEQHKDLEIVKEVISLTSDLPRNGRELLLMGGAFGHLSHPFEDRDLKFSDFKKIITQGLSGKLDRVQEKLDGMNIMISWKDNRLVSARTKKQLANAGADAQTIQAIKSKFKGRGDIADAFGNALDDLNIAIRGLSEKQKQKVFANGKKFVNLEILYPKASITVPYGLKMLVLHGSIEYDEAGNAIGSSQEDARMLGGMIQQINQDIQNTYTIKSNPILKLPQVKDFSAKQSKFLNRLKKLQSEYGLKDSDKIVEYHRRWWLNFIKTKADSLNYKIPNNVLNGLTSRWGLRNKSAFTIPQMKKIDNEKFKNWAMKFNSDKYERQFDINMQKFENIMLNLGAEILRSMNDLLVVSPNEAAQELRKKLSKAIITLSQSKDIKKLTIFKKFLERLNAIGGVKGIVPSEGIVFTYNDKLYKLTGTFTPMHRILTLLDF